MDANNRLSALALLAAFTATGWTQVGASQSKPTIRHHRVAETSTEAVPPEVIEAEKALDKKDYAHAEQLLRTATASNPNHYRAWFDLGALYSQTDRKPQAIEAYQKSVAQKPEIFESNLNLGLLLASSGNRTEAAKYLRAATTLKPSQEATATEAHFAAWDALGHALENDAPDEALAAYAKAEELHPRDLDPHLSAAQIFERKNSHEAAEKEYKQVLQLDPQSTEALAGLTDVYLASKRFAEAEQSLRDYLKLNPQSAAAHMQLGHILAAAEKNDEALAEFEEAQQISPQNREAQRAIADFALAAKKYDEAEQTYRQLIKADPRNPELHHALATALMNQKKYPEAQQEYLISLKLDSSRAEAYEGLATVAAENQDYPLVLQALNARAKSFPETPGTYFLRATAFDHLHDAKQAAANYHLFLSASNGKYPNQEWQAKHRLIALEPKR
jgi:tetratricopeptide (TPR) repeat protein